MAIKNEIHPIQVNILLFLLFHPKARFSQLNVSKAPSDQFNFHLKMLLESNIIDKAAGFYYLTPIGKEFANRLDTEQKIIERQAKLGVVVIGVKKDKGNILYLMQERLKQPYYGFYGFISGKIRWGETVIETANREFAEETGLTGKMSFVGIEHKMDYSPEKELLEDKFFYFCIATTIEGTLIEKFDGGKNLWVKKEDIKTLPNLFPDIPEILKLPDKKKITFWEQKYLVDKY